jgi:hypothetical protein
LLVFLLVFGFIEIQKPSVYKVRRGGCESLRSASKQAKTPLLGRFSFLHTKNISLNFLDEGNLIRRAPTASERKTHRLSHNVKEVLDSPEVAA